MNYQNTDIMSRLAEKLTENISEMGSEKPIYLELWAETRTPKTFWDSFLHVFGIFKSTQRTALVVRHSNHSGFTLEGASWQQIHRKLGWSITKLALEIKQAVAVEYELTHGWEISLNQTLEELKSLDFEHSD